jgi:hypothetical protein
MADLDTFIYIIISIVILVLSGIGSARRKKAQQAQGGEGDTAPSSTGPGSPVPGLDAFSRLEEMFSDQMGFTESSTDEAVFEETVPEAVVQQEEAEPEAYLPEEGVPTVESLDMEDQPNLIEPLKADSLQSDTRLTVSELFSDMDEIKKAVIYSEIFKSKYT